MLLLFHWMVNLILTQHIDDDGAWCRNIVTLNIAWVEIAIHLFWHALKIYKFGVQVGPKGINIKTAK